MRAHAHVHTHTFSLEAGFLLFAWLSQCEPGFFGSE